jgi:hypothetical protein
VHTNQTYDIEYTTMRPDQARCRLLNRTAECAPTDRMNAPEVVDAIFNEGIMPNTAYGVYPDVQLYPILAQAIVPVFNIPGVDKLVLTASRVANIYSALDPMDESVLTRTYRWNDTDLLIPVPNRAYTEQLRAAGAKGRIIRFFRADVSSTTETFRWAITAVDNNADVSLDRPSNTASAN